MSKYRRIVIYLYFCRENTTHNAGFAKMELQNGRCRLEIHVKTPQLEAAPVYLFSRKEELLYGVEMGKLKLENGRGSFVCVFDTAQVGDSPFGYEDIKGILIPQGRDNMIAGQWDKKDVSRRQFRVWEGPPEEHKQETAEKDETIQEAADLQEAAGLQEAADLQGGVDLQGEAKEEKRDARMEERETRITKAEEKEKAEEKLEEKPKEKVEEKPKEKAEEKPKEKAEEKAEEKQQDVLLKKTKEGTKEQTVEIKKERNTETKKEQKIEIQKEENTEERKQSGQRREKVEDKAKEAGKPNIQRSKTINPGTKKGANEEVENGRWQEQDRRKDQMENGHGMAASQLEECGFEESNLAKKLVNYSSLKERQRPEKKAPTHFSWEQLWSALSAKREIFIPGHGHPVEAVKMDLKDLHQLPEELWPLGNNSFLLHGFFNYRFLIYGKEQENGETRFLLGVPGVFSNQERVLASIFGFPGFFAEKKEKFQTGNSGYWYRYFQ